MFDLMQYALIFYDFQLILAQMGCSPVSQHIMGMALAIYLHDCKLARPWDRFATYLAAYTAVQDLEAEALSLLTTHYRAAQGEG